MPSGAAVAILANDRVKHWLLPFLESFRSANPDERLFLVPFDDRLELTRRAADVYRAEIVAGGLEPIDALAARLYPFNPHYRRRLRKFRALALPVAEVLYIDLDTLVFGPLAPLFGHIAPGSVDIVVGTGSDWVFNRRAAGLDFLAGRPLFSDGLFLTSPALLGLDTVIGTIERDLALFRSIRRRHVYTQPVLNYVVHRRGMAVRTIADIVPGLSAESYYRAEGVRFTPDGPVDAAGGRMLYAHWAGRNRAPRGDAFDPEWRRFSDLARRRLGL